MPWWWRRRTSVSKDVKGLHKDESPLDREAALKAKFDEAKTQQKDDQRKRQPAPEVNKMIRESAPGMGNVPSGYMRQKQDAIASRKRLERERLEGNARNRAAEQDWERKYGRPVSTDRERAEEGPAFGNPDEREVDEPVEAPEQETAEQAWARFQERQQELDAGKQRER